MARTVRSRVLAHHHGTQHVRAMARTRRHHLQNELAAGRVETVGDIVHKPLHDHFCDRCWYGQESSAKVKLWPSDVKYFESEPLPDSRADHANLIRAIGDSRIFADSFKPVAQKHLARRGTLGTYDRFAKSVAKSRRGVLPPDFEQQGDEE